MLGQKTFIIAEIGINHNGDLKTAQKLIDLAADSGCNAVKFQKRDINVVYSKEYLDSPRESPWGTTQREQKEGLEFGHTEYSTIDQYCKHKDIPWFASAWDIHSQLFLRDFNLKYNKIASAMIVDFDLLRVVANEKKPTFISTGMCNMAMIDEAVKIFRAAGCPFELMHCVGTYPMDHCDANLRCIPMLQRTFGCNVGWSGHETGLAVSYAAVAIGATSIERHITLDRAMYGSDQASSIGPEGIRMLVGAIRKIEQSLGIDVKRILEKELPIAEKLREHIFG